MSKLHILQVAVIVVLVIQISTLDFFIPIRQFSYGEIVANVKEKTREFSRVIQNGNYLASSIDKKQNVILVGDVMLGRNVEVLMQREGDDYPYRGLPLFTLGSNGAVVGNFEASMAKEHLTTPAEQLKFSVDKDFIPALEEAGFSHLSLANNHSLDYGVTGYKNATSILRQADIATFGHGNSLDESSVTYLNTAKGKLALLGINASQSVPTRKDFKLVLNEASQNSDLQIVYIHWGNEYDLKHSRTQKLLAEELIEAGADLIVGHHPHVVQDIDVINGVVVFYSLGNYIFDQYFSKDVKVGLVLSLELADEPVISLVPVTSEEKLSQPTLMSPERHALFLEELANRSHPSLNEAIKRGIIPLAGTVATSSKMAIMMR